MARARVGRLVCIVGLATAGATIAAHPALAATTRHVSPTGTDNGDCSVNPCKTIGYAIGQSVAGDTIAIAAGTYAEHLALTKSLTLAGAGMSSTIVDGSASGTVITIGSGSASVTVKIATLTITNGDAVTGAGISSAPGAGHTNQVTLANDTIRDNRAVGTTGADAAWGGGIYNAAGSTMTVTSTTVSGNSAHGRDVNCGFGCSTLIPGGDGFGGGIYNAGTLTVSRSTLSTNSATGGHGGSSHDGGGKGGAGSGGGIYDVGAFKVRQSVLSGNSATGGGGGGALGCTHLCSGAAGGMAAGGAFDGEGLVVNSTLVGNSGQGGGGGGGGAGGVVGPGGKALGGALEATGALMVVNSTIAGNQLTGGTGGSTGAAMGGGIDPGSGTTLTNTILANDTATTGPDCDGSVNSGGHNLIRNASSCDGFNGPGDQVNKDPMLGPLQDNGGPTQTIAIPVGSPAQDHGDGSVCAAPPVNGVDQRGAARQNDPSCDVGAYEQTG